MRRPDEIGEISELGRRYLSGELSQHAISEDIHPSAKGDIGDMRVADETQVNAWRQSGLQTLQRGEMVFGLLAAGASSRMDTKNLPVTARELLAKTGQQDIPQSKALVPVVENGGRVYTFLDLFFHNVERFSRAAACPPKTLLFVSETNESEITDHLERAFSNFEPLLRGAHKLVQPLEPQIVAHPDEVKRREANFKSPEAWRQACQFSDAYAGHELQVRKPAGHGEFLHQLIASGMAAQLLDEGVRYLSVRNIDNVPALLDGVWLTLLGYMIENDASMLVEVSERTAQQKGGALIQWKGHWRLAEDPSFEGSSHKATDSFYINNAVAIIRLDYLFPIYETDEEELTRAWRENNNAAMQQIADRGRRKFPTIVEAKPVELAGGVVGAVTPETNMWESTAIVADKVDIHAFAVCSEADEGKDIETVSESEQRDRAARVRFAPVKKWDDYNDQAKQTIIRHVAERLLNEPLL